MALPPVVSINWSTSQTGVSSPFGWNLSNGGNTIRFDVQNSANCGGPNSNVQSGSATASLTAQARFNMTVSLTGLGETQDPGFENMTLQFNGTNIITATSPGGGQGCASGGPVVQTILVPGPYFLPKNSNNSFQLTFTTRDNLFHVGCFYQCNLTFTLLDPPDIFEFYASPNPQTSGNLGVPSSSTALFWSTFGAETLSINQGVGNVTSVSGTTGLFNTNLQSTVGTLSPATRNYTLSATNSAGTTTASTTVEVYNDNTPRNFSIPNQNNVEPNTLTQIFVGQIQDIDMITAVTGGPGVQVSTNSTSWASTIYISNGNSLYVRATSLGFNTDPNGLTNSATFYVDVGTLRRFFTITTRAPIVQEIFDIANYNNKVPFPDIDTIGTAPDHPAQPFIQTDTLTIDDVELSNPNGVEIKTNNPNVQVRKRRLGQSSFTSWKDVRSI